MQNLLMLLIAAGSSSLCACATQPAHAAGLRPVVVVQRPKGEPGDFTICPDGRVLVYPASHPKSCS